MRTTWYVETYSDDEIEGHQTYQAYDEAFEAARLIVDSGKFARIIAPADVPLPPISLPLNEREIGAIEFLVKQGANVRVHWRYLTNFSPDIQKQLQDRGYIRVSYEADRSHKLDEVWLTPAGMKAWRHLKRNYEM
jgi:hypothetical protein